MFAAIAGVLSARSKVNNTLAGPSVTFPPVLSAMPSTAKTQAITDFPVQAKTGFGIALAGNVTDFPVQAKAGFGIALGTNTIDFPVKIGPGGSVALATGTTSFPVNLSSTSPVVLLLHFDSAFTDSSMYAHTPASTGGTVVSGTQSKFGGIAGYFNGGVPLSFNNSAEFSLSGVNFTIEMWAYETSGSLGSLLSHRNAGGPAGWALTTSGLRANINNIYSDTQISWARPSFDTWHHYAWVGLNGTMTVYVDGVAVGTKTGVTSVYDAAANICFGQADDGSENRFQGYIDEARWSKIAQYTTNFTPQTIAFTPPVVSTPVVTYTYQLRSGTASTYFSNYQADFATATFTNFSDTFDSAQLPTGATLTDPTTITMTGVGAFAAPTAIGVTTLGLDGLFSAWEFTIGNMDGVGTVGYFTQGFGPPFDPNSMDGGPLSTYYTSSGFLVGYGGGTGGTPNAPTWTTGDVIGMVYDSFSANVIFYKNGVNVGTVSVVNSGGYTMCGLYI